MSFGNLNVSGLSQRANSLGSVAAQLSSLRAYITYIAAVPRRGFLWGGGASRQTPDSSRDDRRTGRGVGLM